MTLLPTTNANRATKSNSCSARERNFMPGGWALGIFQVTIPKLFPARTIGGRPWIDSLRMPSYT